MTIDELIDKKKAEVRGLVLDHEGNERANVTPGMARRANSILDEIDQLKAVRDENNEFDTRMRNATVPAGLPNSNRTANLSVTREESVYRPDRDDSGAFLADVGRAAMGNGQARQRLDNHMIQMNHEKRTNTGISGDFSGLVVPQYLLDQASHVVDAKSVVRNNVFTTHRLPNTGMTLEVPTQDTATSAAEQTTELSTVSTTQSSTTMLSIPVRTFAAGQVLSRQAVERSSVEDFVLRDMQIRLATAIDSTLLNKATVGMVALAGTNATAATDEAGTLNEILTACATLEAALMGTPVDSVIMNTLVWNALTSFMTANHPLINGSPDQVSQGVTQSPLYTNARGVLSNGARVYTSENIPVHSGTPDTYDVMVAASSECHFWEQPNGPVYIRAEAPLAYELGVQMVLYSYGAFTMQRLHSQDVVSSVTGVDLTYA